MALHCCLSLLLSFFLQSVVGVQFWHMHIYIFFCWSFGFTRKIIKCCFYNLLRFWGQAISQNSSWAYLRYLTFLLYMLSTNLLSLPELMLLGNVQWCDCLAELEPLPQKMWLCIAHRTVCTVCANVTELISAAVGKKGILRDVCLYD